MQSKLLQQRGHTLPCRPSSTIGAAGADRESRRQRRMSPHQQHAQSQASYIFNSSKSSYNDTTELEFSPSQQSGILDSQSLSRDYYPMIPGLLRAASSRVCLDNMPIMRVFSVRVPVTNHTARCLVHIREGQLVLARRNIWAEIAQHPTLLAPKMNGEVIIVMKSSFPGIGFVEISFLGEPLVTIEITAVNSDNGEERDANSSKAPETNAGSGE